MFPPVLSIGFILMAVLAHRSPETAVLASAAASALYVFRSRIGAFFAIIGFAPWVLQYPSITTSVAFWTPALLAVAVLVLPSQPLSLLIRVPRALWPVTTATSIACLFFELIIVDPIGKLFIIPACLGSALLSAGLTRHLALADAHVLAWGEHGLETLTRHLLLGRITSGMLHDLSQPLNVISMANGNLGYIVEHLEISPDERSQMMERIRRIANSTENSSAILSLFRWFGRDGSADQGLSSIRSALERAIAVTRSNVRHSGVTVELQGDALDHRLPIRHGAVEMMAVTALLSAFGGFIAPDGHQTRIRGTLLIRADLADGLVRITVNCTDDEGQPSITCEIDRATLWLVEQVARANDSSFDFVSRKGRSECFRMLIACGAE